MVGRPSPIYKGYNPKEREKNDEDEDDLDKQKEKLEKEREQLLKKAEIRAIKKETFDLEHPRLRASVTGGKRAGGRLLDFAGGIIKEGIRATRPRRTSRKGGVRVRRSMAYPGVYHPVSTDISLAKAIAMNNWSGESTGLMERDFFGNDREIELLGDRNKDINIGSNVQQQFFGDKKDLVLIGDATKEIDLLGKSKKSKQIRYI